MLKQTIHGALNTLYFHPTIAVIFLIIAIVILIIGVVISYDKKRHKINIDSEFITTVIICPLIIGLSIASFCMNKYDIETTEFTITKNASIDEPFTVTLTDGTTFNPNMTRMIGQTFGSIYGDHMDYNVIISDKNIFKYNLKEGKPNTDDDCLFYVTKETAKRLGIIR